MKARKYTRTKRPQFGTHKGHQCQEIPIARWAALGDENGVRTLPSDVGTMALQTVKRLTLESPPFLPPLP